MPSGGRQRAFAGCVHAAQFLYGGWFVFHGLNYWFEFYPDRSIQPGPGLVPAIAESGLMAIVKAMEIAIGSALLANRYAALAIAAAWPITFSIAFVTASHGRPFGIAVACIIVSLNALMSLGHLDRYRPMLAIDAGHPNLDGLTEPQGNLAERHAYKRGRLRWPAHALGALAGLTAAITITYLSLALRN
jgi:hypothetical protein